MITAARTPDPTANKGYAGSLTIVANDTSPRVNVNRQIVLQNFPPILTIMPMEFQFHQRVVQGHSSNFLKHSYACSSSWDIFGSLLDRSTMLALSSLPPPLSPLAFAALSPPQQCSSPAPPLPA
jgi:hypothetical protein